MRTKAARSHRRRRFAAAAVAALLPVLAGGLTSGVAAASSAHRTSSGTLQVHRNEPRLRATDVATPDIFAPGSKTPCVYPATDTNLLSQIGTTTNKTFNCVLVYNNARPTWGWWTQLWVAHPPYPNMNMVVWKKAVPGRRLIISQPMVPDDAPSNWRVLGAEGAYNQYAVQFAQNLVNLGLGDSIIRLGWEANNQSDIESALGNDVSQYADWAHYWANIVTAMKSVPGTHFLFDWTINQYWEPIPLSEWYPGDNAVDIIGIDAYDSGVYNSSLTPAQRWNTLYNEPDGLGAVAAFAKAHGKPISIPEWGLVPPGSAGGGGDDPTYVQGLANFIASNDVTYESYFYQPSETGLLYLPQAPRSLAVYKSQFGSGVNLATGTTASTATAAPSAPVITVTSPTGTTVQISDGTTRTTTKTTLPSGTVAGVARVARGRGSWLATTTGQVVAENGATNYGSIRPGRLSGRVTGIASTTSGRGYWLVTTTGQVFSFGDARWHGNVAAAKAHVRVTAIAAAPSGHGYWITTSNGRVFSLGTVASHPDGATRHIVGSVSSITVTPSGRGYWLSTTDGHVYAFGDAHYAGQRVQPAGSVVAVVAAGSNRGYWLVNRSGRITAFGSAPSITGRGAGIRVRAAS